MPEREVALRAALAHVEQVRASVASVRRYLRMLNILNDESETERKLAFISMLAGECERALEEELKKPDEPSTR